MNSAYEQYAIIQLSLEELLHKTLKVLTDDQLSTENDEVFNIIE